MRLGVIKARGQYVIMFTSRPKAKKYCMSHLGWTHLTSTGVCCSCGSAMVEDEDLT